MKKLTSDDLAFVAAYQHSVADAPREEVLRYVSADSEVRSSHAFYSSMEYYTSIADAHGVWHCALAHAQKTNKGLMGHALDWAVHYAIHGEFEGYSPYEYSTDWAQGGPIIEREGIALYLYGNSEWNAHVGGKESTGPTPLIAAMRCYVASKLGDDVEIPEGL